MTSFLSSYGRERRHTVGDGNCLFRSLSYSLFHTEEYHYELRSLLLRFENLNKGVFQNHLPQGKTIEVHVKQLSHPASWGTDLEILAATTYFKIPAYFCCRGTNGEWVWNSFDLVRPSSQLRYPVIVDASKEDCPTFPVMEVAPTHFELIYWKNTHYDGIVSKLTGKSSEEPPHIEVVHSYVEKTL